jgi:hypothetical protein
MGRRALSLRREALTELTDADLHAVAGAALPTSPAGDCVQALSRKYGGPSHCLCPTEV